MMKTKIEQMRPVRRSFARWEPAATQPGRDQLPFSKVVSITARRPTGDVDLVSGSRRKSIGRKGRRALARRRAIDGAFLAVAVGTAVLVWWGAR